MRKLLRYTIGGLALIWVYLVSARMAELWREVFDTHSRWQCEECAEATELLDPRTPREYGAEVPGER